MYDESTKRVHEFTPSREFVAAGMPGYHPVHGCSSMPRPHAKLVRRAQQHRFGKKSNAASGGHVKSGLRSDFFIMGMTATLATDEDRGTRAIRTLSGVKISLASDLAVRQGSLAATVNIELAIDVNPNLFSARPFPNFFEISGGHDHVLTRIDFSDWRERRAFCFTDRPNGVIDRASTSCAATTIAMTACRTLMCHEYHDADQST